jgi:acetyltransferase-like isoleucine patch superfamily enzyme
VGAIICTNARVSIGDYAFIAHDVILADGFASAPRDAETVVSAYSSASVGLREIVLAENVWIGARATLLGGANIGQGAIVGAGAVINGDVPPFSVVAGNPARVVKVIDRGPCPASLRTIG